MQYNDALTDQLMEELDLENIELVKLKTDDDMRLAVHRS